MSVNTLPTSQRPTRGRGDPDAPRTEHRAPFRHALTPNERVFLLAVANGETPRSIAAEHGVSEQYVTRALRNVKDKLRALNTPHAVALAFAARWLRVEDIKPS